MPMAIWRRPGKASEDRNPITLRRESYDELFSAFNVIFGLAPRISQGILRLVDRRCSG
ncbi:hypothetical protein AGR2A_Lc150021 [Agrobacterium genomosp. 2 str. CFBP 5494]|uniref:Uncharacterized protein n=1 Tax=Agrobacterium genomosp. 2 str. CFBP 5494 TaxID=1183436 RepID=A0A9W5B2U2_9HYPH|nr:hypothetical protein AGR2A_Lc150021 [Agrobacterium genomosp. 2 str. CFBP 5494]